MIVIVQGSNVRSPAIFKFLPLKGTSIGAIAGAMYSIGYTGDHIEKIALETDWQKMFSDQVQRRNLP